MEQVFIIYGTHVLLENLYFIRLFNLAVFKMVKYIVSRGGGDSQQDNSLQVAIITSAWPRRGFEIIHFTNKHELLRFRSYEVMFNFELF